MNDLVLKGQRLTKIFIGTYFGFVLLWLAFQIIFALEFNSNGLMALLFAWLGLMAYGGASWARWSLIALVVAWNALLIWMLSSLMSWQSWTTPILSAYIGIFGCISLVFIAGITLLKPVQAFFKYQQSK